MRQEPNRVNKHNRFSCPDSVLETVFFSKNYPKILLHATTKPLFSLFLMHLYTTAHHTKRHPPRIKQFDLVLKLQHNQKLYEGHTLEVTRSNTNYQIGLSFLLQKAVGKWAWIGLMIDTLMDKLNVCCAVSCIFCSEAVTLFFNHHKWIYFFFSP